MELAFYSFLLYVIAAVFVGMEGVKHEIGSTYAFLLSIILTPIIGFVIVRFSPKNISISRFIKRNQCEGCQYQDDSSNDICEVCNKQAYWVKM